MGIAALALASRALQGAWSPHTHLYTQNINSSGACELRCTVVFTPVPMVLHSPDAVPLGYGGNVGGGSFT